MEMVAVELILWLCFALLLWVLKDSLQNIETELRNYRLGQPGRSATQRIQMAKPQRLMVPMGQYLDQPIYRYAVIDGRHYRFDHVCPKELTTTQLPQTQRWIAPGLIYTEAPLPVA